MTLRSWRVALALFAVLALVGSLLVVTLGAQTSNTASAPSAASPHDPCLDQPTKEAKEERRKKRIQANIDRGFDPDHKKSGAKVTHHPTRKGGKPTTPPADQQKAAKDLPGAEGFNQESKDPCAKPVGSGGMAPSDGDTAVGNFAYAAVMNSKFCWGQTSDVGTAPACRPLDELFPASNGAYYDPHVEWTPHGGTYGTFIVAAGRQPSAGDHVVSVVRVDGYNTHIAQPATEVTWDGNPNSPDKWDLAVTNDKFLVKGMSHCCGGNMQIDAFDLHRYLRGEFSGNADTMGAPYHQRFTLTDQPGYMMAKHHGKTNTDVNEGVMIATVGQSVVYRVFSGLPGSMTLHAQTVTGSDSRISGDVNGAVPGGSVDIITGPQVQSAGMVRQASDNTIELFGAIPTACGTRMCVVSFRYNVNRNTFATRQWDNGAHAIIGALMVNSAGNEWLTYSYASSTMLPAAVMWGPNFHYYIRQPQNATSANGKNVRWGDYFGMDLWVGTYGTERVWGFATNAEGGGSDWGVYNWNGNIVGADENGFTFS